jgi:KipI family sensor histidine kinase inhibitor
MSHNFTFHSYGEESVLIDTPPGTAHQLGVYLRTTLGSVAIDIVTTSHHALVTFARGIPIQALHDALANVPSAAAADTEPTLTTIPVHYDGADLPVVAEQSGLTVNDVIELHSHTLYTVDFFGFSPGFAYLTGLPQQLQLPRRANPRTLVPAGSVAIAAHYCAVYPRASPGGWHLLGHTDMVMFDVDRDPPTLLQPGAHVRFVPATVIR